MKKYNVIWFDDEWKSLEFIIEKASLNGIFLNGFTNSEEGIRELELNISKYDAAIVDGIFYKYIGQSGAATKDSALKDVAMVLEKLSNIKRLPWFILSGQTSFTKEKNSIAEVFKENTVFDKLNDEHLDRLWSSIKAEADKQLDTQIRHEYSSVFALCEERYLGTELNPVLLDLIKEYESEMGSGVSENKLNSIRKVIESIFKLFNRIGVIPNEVASGNGSINNSSKFLAGSSDSYEITSEIAPPAIVFLFRSILSVTQDGSHSGDDLKLKIDQFVKTQPTGYLFSSVLFQLLELLVWTKTFVDTHPNKGKNQLLSSIKVNSNIPQYKGKIEQDSKRNYFCGMYLLSYKRVVENFKIGDDICIFESVKNEDIKTMDSYSLFAKKFSTAP